MRSLESSAIVESFRTLQSNLQFSANGTPLKSILVTSGGPQEGKSTVVSNLAITLSQSGKKVLLVDADLRRPVLHKIFKCTNHVGLTDLLSGVVKKRKVKPIIKPHLFLLTSGSQSLNPPKLINSEKMKQFIQETTSRCDFVLFDSPPVLAVTDTLLLAALVDGVILVLNTGQVTESEAKRTKALLEKAGARILGTVLNNFNSQHGPGYYPYSSIYVR